MGLSNLLGRAVLGSCRQYDPYECLTCGTSLEWDPGECPTCGADDIHAIEV